MRRALREAVVAILTWEAKVVLRKHKPKIIAVTGSAGKTSTKDAIFCVLSHAELFVRKSEKSYNSELGVPLTILGLESGWGSPWRWTLNLVQGLITIFSSEAYPKWLVLEVGADRPGDIRKIARWIEPDVAVITSIPDIPVHVEFFNSPHAIAQEKRRLAEHMKPDGILIINGDEAYTKKIHAEFKDRSVTFGFEPQNAFVATDAGVQYDGKPIGMHFYCEHSNARVSVSVFGALGKPRVYAALAAMAVGEVAGVSLESAAEALAGFAPPPGRMRLLDGIRGSIIIDDTYNSSPAAALSALETLKEIKGVKKKIAVLGDMLELGRFSSIAHAQVGEKAKKCADLLVTIGFRAKSIGQTALDHGMPDSNIRQYEQHEAVRAGKELEPELKEGVVVLVKGSQGIRLEKTVFEIMADPLHAEDLLVRMDPDWKVR